MLSPDPHCHRNRTIEILRPFHFNPNNRHISCNIETAGCKGQRQTPSTRIDMNATRRHLLVAGGLLLPGLHLLAQTSGSSTQGSTGSSSGAAAGGTGSMGEDPLLAACMLVKGRRQ